MDTIARWIENEATQSAYRIIDALTHTDADAMLRFWAERPADGIRIGRDVPSHAIARQLATISLYAPLDDKPDARVHLAGEGLKRRFGRDITGRLMSELFSPADFKIRFAAIMDVITRGEPRLAEITHRIGSLEVMRLELLTLPVVAPNGIDRWALTVAFYF